MTPPTTIFAIADVHVGNHGGQHGGTIVAGINERCRHILSVLEGVVQQVEAAGGVLLVCGDLIDVVQPPAPILAALQNTFQNCPTIIIKGNHETNSDAPNDNALSPLRPVATVVETDTVFRLDGVNVWCIPFRRQPAKEWLADAFAACAAQDEDPDITPRIVAVHLGIEDRKTAKFLRDSPDSIPASVIAKLAAAYDVDHVYAGNWHEQRVWELHGVTVHQIGALVPTDWKNPGLKGYGGLGVYRPGQEPTLHEQLGIRFVKALTDSDIEEVCALPVEDRARILLRAYVEPERVGSVRDHLATFGFKVVEVHAHAVYRAVAAKQAATRAASADNVDASIDGYVRSAPLPKSVEIEDITLEEEYRAGVLQITRDLLVESMTGADDGDF